MSNILLQYNQLLLGRLLYLQQQTFKRNTVPYVNYKTSILSKCPYVCFRITFVHKFVMYLTKHLDSVADAKDNAFIALYITVPVLFLASIFTSFGLYRRMQSKCLKNDYEQYNRGHGKLIHLCKSKLEEPCFLSHLLDIILNTNTQEWKMQ